MDLTVAQSMPAKYVGVVISAHCSSHNDNCAEGKVAGQISAGDDVFDRPIRVGELLALLEPWLPMHPEKPTAGGAVVPSAGSTETLDQVDSLLSGLGESFTVVHSERVAEDRDLVISGVTSQRYLQFLRQRSRELQKKQRLADKWAESAGSDNREWAFLDTDSTTLVNATTEAASRSAVGATLDALEAVLSGRWKHAFVCARPPGHHNGCCEMLEEIDPGGHVYACHGGCVLNETAVAIRHAQAAVAARAQPSRPADAADTAAETTGQLRASKRRAASARVQSVVAPPFGTGCRVAVVDIDVHFGDGTALCFYDDPSVLHISIHLDQSDRQQFPFLVGKAEERGIGPGQGLNVNLPLPPNSGDEEAWALFERCGLPRLVAFEPKLIFLSCGFDGIAGDPTEAETRLTPAWYGRVASSCTNYAPVVATLQGGYMADAVAEAGQRVIAALAGAGPEVALSCTNSTAVEELVQTIEAKLEDSNEWWPVEQSFNYGLADSDDEDSDSDGDIEKVDAKHSQPAGA